MGTFARDPARHDPRRRADRARRPGRSVAGRAAVTIARRGARLRGEPLRSAAPPPQPGPRDQLEPVHRDLAQPRVHAPQPHGVPVDARHLVVLVLRRDVPRAVPGLRARPCSAATSTSSRCCSRVLGRHRRRLAAVRALSGHKVEIGLVPFGSIGMTLFALDLYFASPSAPAATAAGVGAFLARPARLAHARRPRADRRCSAASTSCRSTR